VLRKAASEVAQVEACFHQALALVRRQQVNSEERRTAKSLSRMWEQKGKHIDPHELLV
jgi:hypothetical protein